MPGKSRNAKKKHFHPSKKSKTIMRQETGTTPAAIPAANTVTKPTAPASTISPAKAASAAAAAARIDQYRYISGDLRRIGLLSLIIVVILFILYFTLP